MTGLEQRGLGDDQAVTAQDCIHTVFRSATGNWANQAPSGQRVYGVYATKAECIRHGRNLATAVGVDHVIHDADGAISARNTPRSKPGSS